jgi:hypothetical protein
MHAALGTSGPLYGGPGRECNLDILKVGEGAIAIQSVHDYLGQA